jgi:hypothetical protein
MSFGFLFGSFPGFIVLLSLLGMAGLLYAGFRSFRPRVGGECAIIAAAS